jgi:hypothetical protein
MTDCLTDNCSPQPVEKVEQVEQGKKKGKKGTKVRSRMCCVIDD